MEVCRPSWRLNARVAETHLAVFVIAMLRTSQSSGMGTLKSKKPESLHDAWKVERPTERGSVGSFECARKLISYLPHPLFIYLVGMCGFNYIIAPEAKAVVRSAVSDSVPAILSACSVGHVLTA